MVEEGIDLKHDGCKQESNDLRSILDMKDEEIKQLRIDLLMRTTQLVKSKEILIEKNNQIISLKENKKLWEDEIIKEKAYSYEIQQKLIKIEKSGRWLSLADSSHSVSKYFVIDKATLEENNGNQSKI